jgi:hypothetical protein
VRRKKHYNYWQSTKNLAMSYWEFLIQREDDRAWKTLTSPNLQIVEGKYRVVANTTAIGSAVKTQVFYHTDTQPPQLSQSRSQVVSPEGMLVVLPFTHLQAGMWQFNCNVSLSEEEEICQPLKLKVLPRVASAAIEQLPAAAQQPAEIMQTAMTDLDQLLDNIDKNPEPLTFEPAPAIQNSNPSTPLEPLPVFETFHGDDPFAAALHIATIDQNARSRNNSLGQPNTDLTLQQILATTQMAAIVLDTPDIPLHSYDVRSYEVVVED